MAFDATFGAWQAAKEPREAFRAPLLRDVWVPGGPGGPPDIGGDPSAGSPTDTLLRLNLPC